MIEPASAEKVSALPLARPAQTIHCANCSLLVTRPGQAIAIAGSHQRTFRNPAAYSFHVLCFSQAEGCVVRGSHTTTDTWFPGTAWALAFCSCCEQHLGWHYLQTSGEPPFFGLIAPRLVGWNPVGETL
jgi:hypothetical protein